MPFCQRKIGEQLFELARQGGRSDGLSEDSQACALCSFEVLSRFAHLSNERTPGANFTKLSDRLRTIGIVECQDRGLGEWVCCSKACGMVGITLHFCRS